jgi:hypothetical protein
MTRRRPPAVPSPRPRRIAHRSLTAALVAVALAVAGLIAGPRLLGHAQAAAPAGSPYGHAEHMWAVSGGLRFVGWAIDPSSPTAATTIYITIDGQRAGAFTANLSRPDVAKQYPSAGPNHGFDNTLLVAEGSHVVCISVQNIGAGADTTLWCSHRITLDYGPIGHIDVLKAQPGGVYAQGWAYDPDDPKAPITVTLSIDGAPWRFVASSARPDLAQQVPAAGPYHGFAVSRPVSQGSHQVCVSGVNIGYGSDNTFSCQTLTVDDNPHGHLDVAAQQSGKLRLAGWGYDPDATSTALTVRITLDGVTHDVLANQWRPDINHWWGVGNYHGFDVSYSVAEGNHTACLTVVNVSYGSDLSLGCRTIAISFTPTAALDPINSRTATGIYLTGWASDPDTTSPIQVQLSGSGPVKTYTADLTGSPHSGYRFKGWLPMSSGPHQVCVTALNVLYGSKNSAPSCQTANFAFSPIGHFDSLARASNSTNLAVTGWTLDPDTTAPLSVVITLDGVAQTVTANAPRPDIGAGYPAFGPDHGVAAVLSADGGEHTVCMTAKNVGGGADFDLGCTMINAVNPTAPGSPQQVSATPGYGTATVTWTAPTSDGGAPVTGYTVSASGGGPSVQVGATTTTATLSGLSSGTSYTFAVVARNAVGTSAPAQSPAVTTPAGPPPQTTPAPVSTSRYTRNLRDASASELSMMRSEGYADARANPSGNGYLILLDVGGQDQYDGGVVLSATTRFVSYATLVKDVQAYIDGYHSGQAASAPLVLALGTNNDMDVSATTGAAWANSVVDPLAAYARKYSGITVAGANDIEPGFSASYSATKSWLSGYLGATSAPFVFNGSADGCSWTRTAAGCNNGWTMSGLYYLAAGASPGRIQNLPQIYNTTMAQQWKYISLTGIGAGQPRINFGGPLTEWTACYQAGSCGSLTGNTAWSTLWSNLQSDSRLKITSLPYSTDLRIDS